MCCRGLAAPLSSRRPATETAGIASPCSFHNSHIYEDLVIVEPVNADGFPVEPGTVGARLFVTVLFSRTLPLIRYEMSDRVSRWSEACNGPRCDGLEWPHRRLETTSRALPAWARRAGPASDEVRCEVAGLASRTSCSTCSRGRRHPCPHGRRAMFT